ncbi:anthranilate synthase component I [Leptolyngbya iicbica]|uniref:Anthranilate synthase component 1 n=2 Tax=Cyanophyceae TaxID=3028117 RepID=A0A4Q7EGW4_9CYAN|nr:anthranilate synthase component I [Leptolyngbya sp. LK]RZM82861.1 anthranilate synthase component I [Leptolyngbya sp. LK]
MLSPWYVRSRPLNGKTGSDIFAALYGRPSSGANTSNRNADWETIATLLESPDQLPPETPQARLARYSICAGPPRCEGDRPLVWTPPVSEILPMLAARLATPHAPTMLLDEQGQPLATQLEPFAGGWLGWLGYDLAWEIETLPTHNTDPLPFPVAFWYEPDTFAILDHVEQQLWLAATQPAKLDAMEQAIATAQIVPLSSPAFAKPLEFASSQATYEAAVRRAKEYIRAGDIFQANLSLRFTTETTTDSWTIYQHLHRINPSPFASYWRTPWGAVVSCSPERLVSLRAGNQGQRAETRPIAGTRPRGASPAADQALAQELLSNRKELAEHIMLVDLERNDLGRVCTWGTVEVDELLALEPYSHVMHLVSNVVGQLAPDKTAIDLIRATFPGGTITGCPKVRCMEIIEELEPWRRSLFYGSCGYLDWRGQLDLNILIRTLLMAPQAQDDSQTVWGQVGAGIVADSEPTREWRESLQKAQAQLLAIGLTDETMTAL